MNENEASGELSLAVLVGTVVGAIKYLLSKWLLFLLVGVCFGLIGILYAWFKKPVYTAEITFAPENDKSSSLGVYAGLAAQFGYDLGGGGGGAFEGENLVEFLHSKMLIEKTLLSPSKSVLPEKNIISYYIRANELDKDWKKNSKLSHIEFIAGQQPELRSRDSLLNLIIKNIQEQLLIQKVDRRLNIISASIRDKNELFAKAFIEQLVNNGIEYYVDYRSKKTRDNLSILQRQTDSVKGIITGGIVSVAQSTDLNINPIRQVPRANVQRKQIDIQVSSQLYGELVKQLELTKIALRKETPFIQIIDTPKLPLEKEKMGRLKGGVIFAFIGFVLTAFFLIFRRLLSTKKADVTPQTTTTTI